MLPKLQLKKKCTFCGINILVCLLLASPRAPAQEPQQQPSSEPSGKRLIPTVTNMCCNKSPHTLTWVPTCLPGIATKERGFWQSGARLSVSGRCCFPKDPSNCYL